MKQKLFSILLLIIPITAGLVDQNPCKQSADALECSGFGTCINGLCQCTKHPDPFRMTSGKYCECNNFGCDRYEGRQCGGNERGVCDCSKCKCKESYTGDNCGNVDCNIGKKECVKNGKICSGNGKCDCDKCNCDAGFDGEHCEHCVSCPGKCNMMKDCVLCQAFNEPSTEECAKMNCSLNVLVVNKTEERCLIPDDKNCFLIYSIRPDYVTGIETIYVQRERKCVKICKNCPTVEGEYCGGVGRGECDCGKCTCKNQYKGANCGLSNCTIGSCGGYGAHTDSDTSVSAHPLHMLFVLMLFMMIQ